MSAGAAQAATDTLGLVGITDIVVSSVYSRHAGSHVPAFGVWDAGKIGSEASRAAGPGMRVL